MKMVPTNTFFKSQRHVESFLVGYSLIFQLQFQYEKSLCYVILTCLFQFGEKAIFSVERVSLLHSAPAPFDTLST